MSRVDPQLRRDRRVVTVASVIACALALIQAVAPLVSDALAGLLALSNGFVFAYYASSLYLVRGTNSDDIRACCVAFLGVTHLAWMILALNYVPMDPRVVTAIVLGISIALLSWRAWMIVPVSVMLAVSLWLGHFTPFSALKWTDSASLSALHLGFLAALVPDTLQRLSRPRSEHMCGSCGYDLRGLPAHTCPECGASASR